MTFQSYTGIHRTGVDCKETPCRLVMFYLLALQHIDIDLLFIEVMCVAICMCKGKAGKFLWWHRNYTVVCLNLNHNITRDTWL